MDSKLRIGLLVLVVLVVVGVLGYKFVGQDWVGKNSVKQQANLECVTEDPKDTADISAKLPNKEVNSTTTDSSKSQSSTKAQTSSKASQTIPVAESEKQPEPKTEESKTESSKQPVWILFRSTTCRPCVEMQKTMDTLAPEFQDKVKFVAIDVNDPANEELIKKFGIQYIPTTFLFDKNEKLFFQQIGAMSVEDMRAKLNALLEVK